MPSEEAPDSIPGAASPDMDSLLAQLIAMEFKSEDAANALEAAFSRNSKASDDVLLQDSINILLGQQAPQTERPPRQSHRETREHTSQLNHQSYNPSSSSSPSLFRRSSSSTFPAKLPDWLDKISSSAQNVISNTFQLKKPISVPELDYVIDEYELMKKPKKRKKLKHVSFNLTPETKFISPVLLEDEQETGEGMNQSVDFCS